MTLETPPVFHPALLTVAVSTMGPELQSLMLPPPDPSIQYLVVVQKPVLAGMFPYMDRPDVRYALLSSVGLSRSRNAALALVETPVMLLADDDLEMDVPSIKAAAVSFARSGAAFGVARITQGPGRAVRHEWPRNGSPSDADIGYFASCEIFLSMEKVRLSGLAFDPAFGVGSGVYPAGEEALFLLHFIRSGASGVFLDHTLSHHEDISSGYRDLGAAGDIGKMRFNQTLRPRRFPILRRVRFALSQKQLSLVRRCILVLSPSPAVPPVFLATVHDPQTVIYQGFGMTTVAACLEEGRRR